MVRLNLLLLAALVVCALSLVSSRHQARKLFVELEREQASAAQLRDRVRPVAARAVDLGHAGRASRRSRASSCGCSCRRRAASRSSPSEGSDERADAGIGGGAPGGEAAAAAAAAARAAGVRLLPAALRRPRRAVGVPAGHRQRVPAGAGQLALQPRDRGAGASRPDRRSCRRGARDLDADEVAVGVSGQGRGEPGAARRACAHPGAPAAAAREEARAGQRLRLPRAASAARGRRAGDAPAHQGHLRPDRVPPLSIPAARR